MAANEIRVGDIGTQLKVTIKNGSAAQDISGYTTKTFIFKKPDGTTATKDGSFITDGTDGLVAYTTQSGDLDVAGEWRFQVLLSNTAPTQNKTDILRFTVHNNLTD